MLSAGWNVRLTFWAVSFFYVSTSNIFHDNCIYYVRYYRQYHVFLYRIANVMAERKNILLPKHVKMLEEMGGNIRLARLRRKLSLAQVAERADISRTTLYLIERGGAGVSLGAYMQVLVVLGLGNNILDLAKDDVLGRKLQDAQMLSKKAKRATSTKTSNKAGNDKENDGIKE